MATMAVLVGLGGGLGTVLFRKAVDGTTALVSDGAGALGIGQVSFLILPAIGGLIVGLWMYWVAVKGPGQGVAGIMEAVALHGGRIAPRGSSLIQCIRKSTEDAGLICGRVENKT